MSRAELTVQVEPWLDCWPEADALGREHYDEVDGGVEPRRKYCVDEEQMARACKMGILRIVTARAEGALVGYLTWQLSLDAESKNLMIAQQGAWFVRPGYPRAASTMFKVSVDYLKGLGVQCLFPHHRLQGRGQGLDKFFRRRGAKEIQRTFCLWIGA